MKPLSLLLIIGLLTLTACSTSTPAETETAPTETTQTEVTPAADETEEPDPVAPVSPQTPPLDEDSPVFNPAGPATPNTSQVLFPDGNETLEVGADYTISWESEGIELINLELHEYDRKVATIGESLIAYNSTFAWTPAASLLEGEDFRRFTLVMVDAQTGEVHDSSDEAFVLQARQTE